MHSGNSCLFVAVVFQPLFLRYGIFNNPRLIISFSFRKKSPTVEPATCGWKILSYLIIDCFLSATSISMP